MNPILQAFFAALLFGAAAPFSKILLGSFSAFQLAGILYLGAALAVALVLLISRGSFGFSGHLGSRNRIRLTFAIFFGGVLGPLFLLNGLQLAAAGSVSLWLILEMVLTALLGHFFFKDNLGVWGWIGGMGCLSGSVLLSVGEGSAGLRAGAWVTLACLCWGLDNHLTALIDGLKPLQTTFWKGLTAGSANLTVGILVTPFHPAVMTLIWGLALGAFSYGASIALYIRAAQVLGATRSQMIFSAAPFFGLLISSILLREDLTWIHGVATLLFTGSLALLFRDRHAHFHSHESTEHVHGHRHDDGHHAHEHSGMLASTYHSHRHTHSALAHSHAHLPDIHHRHNH